MMVNVLTPGAIDLYYIKRRDPNTTENDGHACRNNSITRFRTICEIQCWNSHIYPVLF